MREAISKHVNSNDNLLTLSTIHSSKGLEYERVYLLDIFDGILPAKAKEDLEDDSEAAEYEESRRLYYVAMTRAKDDLYLFHCQGQASSFTSEIMRYLPSCTDDSDDLLAAMLEPRIGMRYSDRECGKGTVIAQCESRFLVRFENDQSLCLSLDEMIARHKPVDKSPERRGPASTNRGAAPKKHLDPDLRKPAAGPDLPGTPVVASDIPRKFRTGAAIRHTFFGDGIVMRLENGILTVMFKDKGEKRILLSTAVENHLLLWP